MINWLSKKWIKYGYKTEIKNLMTLFKIKSLFKQEKNGVKSRVKLKPNFKKNSADLNINYNNISHNYLKV